MQRSFCAQNRAQTKIVSWSLASRQKGASSSSLLFAFFFKKMLLSYIARSQLVKIVENRGNSFQTFGFSVGPENYYRVEEAVYLADQAVLQIQHQGEGDLGKGGIWM